MPLAHPLPPSDDPAPAQPSQDPLPVLFLARETSDINILAINVSFVPPSPPLTQEIRMRSDGRPGAHSHSLDLFTLAAIPSNSKHPHNRPYAPRQRPRRIHRLDPAPYFTPDSATRVLSHKPPPPSTSVRQSKNVVA
ncbi:hypothetical protein SISNIDRAFT_492129 [Sistotremastrum niveocremeum HHB9708]|uniref:Uncharacterized protein n=1 Tax=Sistotremastrum niveocremeum HHB9708 TaxID=1314777 RepID=A0A164M1V4_9AGAM|nr:hypothetical protein SISNIDRAFT_492129 [Sistotremastrum niveocremeum HHB9708]